MAKTNPTAPITEAQLAKPITEAQLANGLIFTFGGKEFRQPERTFMAGQEWRHKLSQVQKRMLVLGKEGKSLEGMALKSIEDVLDKLTIEMPDQILSLFFDYCVEIPKDEVLAIAMESEMIVALRSLFKSMGPTRFQTVLMGG